MKTTAAVLVELAKPLELAELEIPALKSGQVLVEVDCSGVCHTQLLEAFGHRGEDRFLPHCLGHEGSGIIVDIGPGVTKVRPGEHVILSWMKGSGADVTGTVYRWNGRKVNAGPITTFGRHSVISENRLTPIGKDFPKREAALLGCAVPTGFGAVFNTAEVRPGQSVAVFGAGGIGLCAVAAAKNAGAVPVIVIDVDDARLDLAEGIGATHTISASNEEDVLTKILELCPGGVDVAIEASGRPHVMAQALQSVRNQGGAAVIIGNARHGERVEIDPWQLNLGKRLLGTWGGDNQPDRHFPRYAQMLAEGKVNVAPLLAKTYRLEEINGALSDLKTGKTIRPLIDMSTA